MWKNSPDLENIPSGLPAFELLVKKEICIGCICCVSAVIYLPIVWLCGWKNWGVINWCFLALTSSSKERFIPAGLWLGGHLQFQPERTTQPTKRSRNNNSRNPFTEVLCPLKPRKTHLKRGISNKMCSCQLKEISLQKTKSSHLTSCFSKKVFFFFFVISQRDL